MKEREVVAQMRADGIIINGIECFERIIRLKTYENQKKNNGWYIFYRINDEVFGAYGDWSKDMTTKVSYNGESNVEKYQAEGLMKEMREQYQKERAIQRKDIIKRATIAWTCLDACPSQKVHPYLINKQVKSYGLRTDGQQLAIPLYHEKDIVGIQYIGPDGRKLFLKGTQKAGAYYKISGNNTYALCEGYATGASIHEATGWTVIVCFDCGNLINVAKSFHKKRNYIVCGDNDHNSKDNVGYIKGKATAELLGCDFIYPETEEGITDFNDIHCRYSIDVLRDKLLANKDDEFNTDFPKHVFPPELRDYIEHRAWCVDSHADFGYAGLLAVVSVIINSAKIFPFKGSSDYFAPNLYLLVVGCSGAAKTPMLKISKKVLDKLQLSLSESFAEAYKAYEDNKKRKKSEQVELEEPFEETVIITKGTIEAIKNAMNHNENCQRNANFLYWLEEFASFINGLGKYTGGKSDDIDELLSLWDGSFTKVICKDRSKSNFVKRAYLSLIGGIQPEVMRNLFNNRGNGFFERFLFVFPEDKQSKTYFNRADDSEKRQVFDDYLNSLFEIQIEDVYIASDLYNSLQKYVENIEDYAKKHDFCVAGQKWKTNYYKMILLTMCIWKKPVVDEEILKFAYELSMYFNKCWAKSAGEMSTCEDELIQDKIVDFLRERGKSTLRDMKRQKFKAKDEKKMLEITLAKMPEIKKIQVGRTNYYTLR